MFYSEDSFRFWLRSIRERPGMWLGEKSLFALVHFWHGYTFGRSVEIDEHSNEPRISDRAVTHFGQHFMDGFEQFAYSHFGCKRTTQGWWRLIAKNCGTDAQAFDKFFELLDEFLAQKGSAL